jgi:response regulator RpfG family c-di-GMP phosphodiesterase
MTDKPLRILVAVADLTEVLVLRRLLRDTPYHVDVVRSAFHALRAISQLPFNAVIADDHLTEGMSGPKLLAEVERAQPRALRILLADKERRHALAEGHSGGRYRLVFKPYYAAHVQAALLEQIEQGGAGEAVAPPPARERRPEKRRKAPQLRVVEADAQQEIEEEDEEPTHSFGPSLMASMIRGDDEGDTSEVEVTADNVSRRILVRTFAELVEAKTGAAPGHASRINTLAVELGRELRLGASELAALDDAALLHDVGELAVPSALFALSRRLTPNERRGLLGHVEAGWRVVRRAGLPTPVQAGVRHHHERWDGRGYPDQLDGERIPLIARIIAVVDVWDAICSSRPYRTVAAVADAARMLSALGGAQLDPELVKLFVSRKIYRLVDWTKPPRGSAELLMPQAAASPRKPSDGDESDQRATAAESSRAGATR